MYDIYPLLLYGIKNKLDDKKVYLISNYEYKNIIPYLKWRCTL